MYEYSTTLPASVSGNADVTLTAVLNDDSYTDAGITFAGAENPSKEIENGTFTDSGKASELRTEDDKTIVLTLTGQGAETKTYTINVSV